jgi:hypothetical protein
MPAYEVIRIGGGLPVRCPEFGSLPGPVLPDGLDPKQYAVRPAGDPNWRDRERARFEDGTYKQPPWEPWILNELEERLPDHFLHISVKDPTKVSYTETPEKGEVDRQSAPMAPGRYLERFARHWSYEQNRSFWAGMPRPPGAVPEGEPWLEAKQIRQLASMLLPPDPLKFASTPDEIEAVYVNGPNSCMSHDASEYSSSCHPARVYGAGDLSVAYLKAGDDISGRALVWPDKKVYGRIYGDEHRMEVALGDLGYQYGSLVGAKLLRIEDDDGVLICPYIDRHGYVEDCGDHLRIATDGIEAQSTDGLIRRGVSCESCGDVTRQDDIIYFQDTAYCERCHSDHTFYCHGYEDTYHTDDYAGECIGLGAVCQDYYEMHCYTCERTERIYCEADDPATEVDNEIWGPRAVAQDAVLCERGDTYHRPENTTTLKDTGETVSLDWAHDHATEVDGDWYETAPADMEAA